MALRRVCRGHCFALYRIHRLGSFFAGGRAAGVRQHNLALRSQFGYRRKHGAKDFADGRKVVAGDPVGQYNQLGSERRKKIHDFCDFANLCGWGRVLNSFNDYAYEGFVAKGHEDAAAGLHGIAQGLGNGVGKRIAQGNWQRHVAKREGHVGV